MTGDGAESQCSPRFAQVAVHSIGHSRRTMGIDLSGGEPGASWDTVIRPAYRPARHLGRSFLDPWIRESLVDQPKSHRVDPKSGSTLRLL